MSYTDPLPAGISLQIFDNDSLIFQSGGKWLYPLFEAENFLKTYKGPADCLSSHDTALGKAAALLSIRLGIKKINAELLSQNALNFINQFNEKNTSPSESFFKNGPVQVKYSNLVPKLMCATENLLEDFNSSPDECQKMYFILRQRACLVQGVSVKLSHLTSFFGSINDMSLEIKAGEHILLVGENGAGKTSLLKMIGGIMRPEKGSIFIDEKPLSKCPKYTIGYIPQSLETNGFDLCVEEVIGLGVKTKNRKEKKEIVEKALKRTSSLYLKNRDFSSLSGGEKQKVCLARCLAQDAKLLLLDEPTANLDRENRLMVMDILRSLTLSEMPTIIVATHDSELEVMKGWKILKIGGEERDGR